MEFQQIFIRKIINSLFEDQDQFQVMLSYDSVIFLIISEFIAYNYFILKSHYTHMLQHGYLSQHFQLLFNHQTNVQDYLVKIENNMDIKEEYFHQTSVIKKISRARKKFNKSSWTLLQNIQYCEFVRQNISLFESTRSNRHMNKVNKLISQCVTSRSPEQCRSHHQKMLKAHGNLYNMIEHIDKIEKNNPNVNPNFTVRIRKKKDPQQKKHKGKGKRQEKQKKSKKNTDKDKNNDKEKDNNQDKEKYTNKEKDKNEDNSVRIKIEEISIPFHSYVCYWDRLARKWIKQIKAM